MLKFQKSNAEEAAHRLYRFYTRQMPDEVSVLLSILPRAGTPTEPPLVEPKPDDSVVRQREPLMGPQLSVLLEMYRRGERHNRVNPDDSLPEVMPVFQFEGAMETAMLGGQVKFMGTRLHTYGEPIQPLIGDYRCFDWRLPREDNPWFRCYLESYRFMVENGDSAFALTFQGMFNGLNLPVQLRGTEQAYLDMHEDPEALRRLLDYTLDLNLYLYGRVEQIVAAHHSRLYGDHPLREYRTDCQPPLSVDAYSLCGPGTLRQWGLAQLSRFTERVGGGTLHIHENSLHVIEEAREIPNLRRVYFTEGVGWPRPFDLRWELRRRMTDIPIALPCRKDELRKALVERSLPGATQYCATDAALPLEEAQALMDQVKRYRAPLSETIRSYLPLKEKIQ